MNKPTGSSSKNTKGWQHHQVEPQQAGWTVEAILTGPLQISKRQIQKLTRARAICLNRRGTFLAQTVQAGDVVAVGSVQPQSRLMPTPMDLEILYEDEDLIAINKPAGLLVHPTRPDQIRTLAHGLAHYYQHQPAQTPPGIHPIHRLDRDTTGVVLVAKSPQIQHLLSQQVQTRRWKREYLALVHGCLETDSATITASIGKHPHHPHLRCVQPQGDLARTHVQVIERWRQHTFVRLELETGRTHQIRVHLQYYGHPVVGDRQYGDRSLTDRQPLGGMHRQALHGSCLRCHHPRTSQPLVLSAPLPEDMARLLKELRSELEHGERLAAPGGITCPYPRQSPPPSHHLE